MYIFIYDILIIYAITSYHQVQTIVSSNLDQYHEIYKDSEQTGVIT